MQPKLQFLALSIAGTVLLRNGGCRHVYYLIMDQGPNQLIEINRLFYICQVFAIMGLATGRVAVAALILRLMGPSRWRKLFLWFTMISTFLISMLNSILLFAPCKPAAAVWNPFASANCWNPVIMTDVTIATSSGLPPVRRNGEQPLKSLTNRLERFHRCLPCSGSSDDLLESQCDSEKAGGLMYIDEWRSPVDILSPMEVQRETC